MKYAIGDRVEIVNYGQSMWFKRDGRAEDSKYPVIKTSKRNIWYDISPELIGKQGIIARTQTIQGISSYAICFKNSTSAWYSEDQMKMIKKTKP